MAQWVAPHGPVESNPTLMVGAARRQGNFGVLCYPTSKGTSYHSLKATLHESSRDHCDPLHVSKVAVKSRNHTHILTAGNRNDGRVCEAQLGIDLAAKYFQRV